MEPIANCITPKKTICIILDCIYIIFGNKNKIKVFLL